MKKTMLLGSVAFAAVTTPAAAFAQAAPADTAGDVPIIVTATLREADIQDVPIAVTAVGPEQLERQGVNDVRALGNLSASFNIQSSQTESQGTSIRLRGVGTTGNNIGLESSVGVFIDGVYQSRPGVALGDMVDIERVEVLRGPQGTLFGRNTSAGALSVTTQRPDLMEFEGFANASYGNYDFVNVQGGISVPIAPGYVGARLTGSYRRRDGYVTSTTGAESHNRDRYVIRGQLLFEPSPDISLRIIGDYQNADENCCDGIILRETELVDRGAYAAYGLPNDGVSVFGPAAFDDYISSGSEFVNETEQWGLSAELVWNLGAVELTYIGAYRDFTGISRQDDFTGLATYSVAGITDPTNQPLTDDIQTWTHELRLQGSAFDGRLDWLVGGYYSDESITEDTSLTLGSDYQASASANIFGLVGNNFAPFGPNPLAAFTRLAQAPLPMGFNPADPATFALLPAFFAANPIISSTGSYAHNFYRQEGEAFSVFTHNVFHISDEVSITLGARYVDETKDGSFDQLDSSSPACLTIANGFMNLAGNLTRLGVPPGSVPLLAGAAVQLGCFPFATTADSPASAFLPLPRTFDDTFKDDELLYVAQIAWEPNDDTMFYASHSHGFKSGGFNLDSSAAFVTNTAAILGGAAPVYGDPRFLSEEVDAFELGAKVELFDRMLTLNTAAFYMDLSNFQVLEFTGVQFQTFNASGARSIGLEIEALARFTDYLRGNMALTFADAQYDEDCDFGGTLPQATPLCGATLTNAPFFTGLWGMTYDGPLGGTDWGLLANVNVRYETSRRTATAPVDGGALAPNDIQADNIKVNARLGISTPDDRFTFEIWGTNIFDERTRTITANTPLRGLSGFRSRIAFPEDPRFYGLTVRARF